MSSDSGSIEDPRLRGMTRIEGGEFAMGSNDFYPEEKPVHQVAVSGFWIDRQPVTIAEYRRFVKATGHVTNAERTPDAAEYPDADPELLVPGSLVFQQTQGPVDLSDYRNWWAWTPGADWRHPEGPGSTITGRERHPVTHVAHEDAAAYARWAGKELSTEAEWEFAARGGLDQKVYCWGDEFTPRGKQMANTWQGEFPWKNLKPPDIQRTSPVRMYPANGYGLYDMAGNVWEWTSDFYTPKHSEEVEHPCCAPQDPRVTSSEQSYAKGEPGEHIPRRVTKGGSHLCAANYCLRYRPSARQGEAVDTSTSHIGFRCVLRGEPPAA